MRRRWKVEELGKRDEKEEELKEAKGRITERSEGREEKKEAEVERGKETMVTGGVKGGKKREMKE